MIGETGIWGEEEAQHHQHSENLADAIYSALHEHEKAKAVKSGLANAETTYMVGKHPKVYDFGCGLGHYVKHLHIGGFNAYGIEGRILKDCVCKDRILQFDLTQPFDLLQGHVICLEVGEHIPKEFEQHLLNHITKTCNGMLFLSWALPNQPGLGHVNCQPQDYIIAEVCRRGFVYKEELTKEVRLTIEDHCDWFQRTLLIFERV